MLVLGGEPAEINKKNRQLVVVAVSKKILLPFVETDFLLYFHRIYVDLISHRVPISPGYDVVMTEQVSRIRFKRAQIIRSTYAVNS